MASAQKKCGKCDKTVYPTEEIRCLDRSWHKGCFKCTTCGMTLNIKTAKGYEKVPYCNVHYPTLKATVVTSNPEIERVKNSTSIQSNAAYHKDFNENKGKFTAVVDDVATTRAKEQQKNVSQVEYVGKRKESTSQILAPEATNDDTETSKPTIGRVADYDPLNNQRGSLSRGYEPTSKILHATKFTSSETSTPEPTVQPDVDVPAKSDEPPPSKPEEVEIQPPANDDQPKSETPSTTLRTRAIYAYTAEADDELTFAENDEFIDCEVVDDGWMRGQHEKTGQIGLFPSNYVEKIA